ncbi:APC amino acid permease [Crepidotus variabilis]|uniref:APC amino acid permease n=1 Tax=Crepidotus variabilis TaxID=179855 RepID=A0A9P6ELT0_9AGAR|nr:APC amino acid permease [Crepidotus variabilis]
MLVMTCLGVFKYRITVIPAFDFTSPPLLCQMDSHFEKDELKHQNGNSASFEDAPKYEFYDPSKESRWTRLGLSLESFKRAPGTTGGQVVAGSNISDIERIQADAPMLQQKMKPRHLQMIAVGGSIGTGLFVGSGSALHDGGPAGVLIAWILTGIMLINVTQALGEMAILYPVSGGFYTLAIRFLDPSFAFAMGWNYFLQWAIVLPLEITVAGFTVQYWGEDILPLAAWIAIFWLAITIVSIFGTLGFAEEEFWSSCLKLFVVVMFIFIGVICICGGGPSNGQYSHYTGGRFWHDPGPFANGFKGVCSVFVTAAFAFSGTELIGLAASETPNPRKTMPAAVKGTFWRITIIYVMSLIIIGLLVPYNEDRLIGGSGANASPFVIALDHAGIKGLNHFVNVTICISVLSIGLSCVYAGSRTLTAMGETGYAPRLFSYVDKSSRPLFSVILVLLFGALAYMKLATSGSTTFNWFVAVSGLSTLFSWLAICLCHIRFRRAWKVQGHSLEELPFQALGGAWGSWFGVVLIVIVLIAQFYIAIWPIGGMSDDPKEVAETFFQVYLAVPVMILFYIIGYAWKRTLPQRAHEIDLDTGRKSWLTVEEMREYRAERKRAPLYIRVYRILFTN